MQLDTMKAVYSTLANGMPGAAQIILADAIRAAEREPPADVVAVPRTVVLAWAALGDSFDPLTGDGETTFGDESCRLAGKLDAALGLPRGVMWRHTADALRALASAPCAQVADRPVGQVAPAVPAVDPQPVAVAGAATLADVEARLAIVELGTRIAGALDLINSTTRAPVGHHADAVREVVAEIDAALARCPPPSR